MQNDDNKDLAALRRNYGDRAIDQSTLDPDPIQQFKEWFDQAKEVEIYEPNAMTLATVSANGAPSCRVVLLKELPDDGFVFYTDYSSRKGDEIKQCQAVALTFWWDRIHRSVRIEGVATKVSAEQSDRYFNSRPRGSRVSAAASDQSTVLASRDTLLDRVAELETEHGDGAPSRPARWGGYHVSAHTIEFWQGRSNRLHDRVRYRRENLETGQWIRERLSP